MSTIHRYIYKELARYLVMVLTSVAALYLVVDFFEKADQFVKAGLGMERAVAFFACNLPFIMEQIAPVGFLLAVLITFGLMGKNNEIVALKSSGVSAFYLIKKRNMDFAKISLKIGLVIALAGSLLQLITGHASAVGVAQNQPAKLAAFEGHYAESSPAALSLFGWVNESEEKVELSVSIPGFISWLISGDAQEPITGLKAFPPEDRPPVNLVFQSYHAMIAIGTLLIVLSVLGVIYWIMGRLFRTTWLLRLLVISVVFPQLGNQLGWISAEVGRQPWIVYGILRTEQGISKVVSAGEILTSLILFALIYMMLFALFIYLLDHKIKKGPEEELELQEGGARA